MSQRPIVSKRGLAVLGKAFAAMRKWPDTVDMSDWCDHDRTVTATPRRPAPYCGTVACFAGHVALAATGRLPDDCDEYEIRKLPKSLQKIVSLEYPYFVPCADLALAVLGVPMTARAETWGRLFTTHRWPREFRSRYDRSSPGRERAATVIARVRHWLKTGK